MKKIIKKIIPSSMIKFLKNKFIGIRFLKKIFRFSHLKKLLIFPSQIAIEVTSICNARCKHCEYKDLGRTHAHMKMDLYRKIIDECYDFKKYCKKITLFWMGEPFLDPDFFKKVKYAKEKNFSEVLTYSNGSLLTSVNCQKLIDSKLDRIVFSVDGATKKSYESIRIGLSYDKVVGGIKRLADLKRKLRVKYPQIEIQMILTPFNEHELDLFNKTWKGVADNYYAKKMHVWSGDKIDKSLMDYSHRLEKVKHPRFTPCFYLWKSMIVAQDGRVALCCVDPRIQEQIGDLKKETIYDVWHGDKLNKIRKLHLIGKMDKINLCQRCNFQQIKEYPWWWYDK